jgi:hypothetical protein
MSELNHARFIGFRLRQCVERFFMTLRSSGNVAASAYAAGVLVSVCRWYDPRRMAIRQKRSASDLLWGTDTSGMIQAPAMHESGSSALCSNYYKAADPQLFGAMMNSLDVDFSQYSLVDYGTGKGLIVLLASEYPLRTIFGVELSRKLHAIDRANLSKYKSTSQKCRGIELLCADATTHELPPGPVIVFLYDPITNEKLFQRLVDNIARSLKDAPRDAFILYAHPTFRTCVEGTGLFVTYGSHGDSVIFRGRQH